MTAHNLKVFIADKVLMTPQSAAKFVIDKEVRPCCHPRLRAVFRRKGLIWPQTGSLEAFLMR